MGRKKKKQNPLDYIEIPKLELSQETKNGLLVIFILIVGVLCLLGLFDLAGPVGAYLGRGEMLAFGWGRWLFPILLFAWGIILYKKDRTYIRAAGILGIFLALLSIEALLHLIIPEIEWRVAIDEGRGGGFLGMFFASVFVKTLSFWGALTVLLALIFVSILLIFNTSLVKVIGGESFFVIIARPFKFIFGRLFGGREEKIFKEENETVVEINEPIFSKKAVVEELGEPSFAEATEDKMEDDDEDEEGKDLPAKAISRKKHEDEIWKMKKVKIDLPIELLDINTSRAAGGDIKTNQVIIQRTLENFGIPVEMGETKVGPTVTQYTFKPAEGVKLSRITTLNNDLSLALAAHPLRIEAPIPGKALVGIEVPNRTKALVSQREVLEDKSFQERKSNLMITLGKDVSGACSVYDITKMPHLLVAGATNSGKSVCLNSIIISLLYQNDPENLRFIMVDPKRVELTVYDGIPHLLTPVVTNVQKTINALRWCLNEMDRRFDVLQNFKKRNIAEYNKTAKEKMPYIVFIVDELADLMVTAGRDIEGSIIRLAQMARAVGIHLVLATQRPSVDVITGLIKANMPTRIAFSVASGVDSKTILDSLGAEKLLGKGDMLFQTPEMSKPKRVQGAYVSDEEIHRIVSYIKEKAGEFEYVEGVTDSQRVRGVAGVGMEGGEEQEDDLTQEAEHLIIETGKASATFLQRKLSVGYARAAKLLDILEEMGVVGPANGSKPREILISKEQYQDHIDNPTATTPLHGDEEENNNNSLGEAPEDEAIILDKEILTNDFSDKTDGKLAEEDDLFSEELKKNEEEVQVGNKKSGKVGSWENDDGIFFSK
ncbi:MAG: DNA translocase FtsK 4TM domain-containing protein [Patescibacteria group bacterium]|jgi:S-DNA-T family DNA segregation ATPase FtsK/SpoIIIE